MILGAGFGGLELSARLAEDLADDVRVTLIDQNDSFIFGFAKLDVMFGRRGPDEVRLFYRDIAKPNVQFRQETVLSIDPQARRVRTDRATYDADILVVALGADLDPGATPGLVEGGHEFYSTQGAESVANVLPSFQAGVAVIGVLGPVFKCPPAPNEAALMLHDYLSERGVRDAVTIHLVNPLGSPIPVSEETSAAIVSMLAERGIEHWPSSQVERLDPAAKVAHLADGRRLPFDLFLAVPVHRAPAVVLDAGLTEDGWIPVDPATFATRFPAVYAVGDVTNAPVPRAGTIAEGEAATLADVLLATLKGRPQPPPYSGAAVCYIETGGGTVAKVDVDFLSGAEPTAVFTAPSAEVAEEKRRFGSVRAQRWFGD
ncbi:FAD-dependent pyridine nucleotide-disulphide oxidoreductase [Modestobacter italicus]|uniref:FAD-dependent pyridine nucleotide-disulphide oxidoreductase n=1 Tax=Modestobacter italicus (strain DSM 44449 / CECT 9708 / BC 501) TaxID=2732864 RepID=I4ES85_MODI5|nr:FAD-dependent pyridine nucleotide-disulphide oxidoreductase [Modestobacter marinus]